MLTFRFATENDVELYFKWASDSVVRQNSLKTNKINFKDHVVWFNRKIEDPNVFMYVFVNEYNETVGQVIIERKNEWVIVGQSVAKQHRGKKYSTPMLTISTDHFLEKFPKETIVSVVRVSNIASLKMSANSGFSHIIPENLDENVLVLKGYLQNDNIFIEKAKHHYNLA